MEIDDQREIVIQRVGVGIQHITTGERRLDNVLAEVHQARGHVTGRNLLQTLGKGRLGIAVLRLDGCVFGLGNLLSLDTAVLLVETIVIVGKIFTRDSDDIITGN